MKKGELKTGMKLVTRTKDEFIVFRNFEHSWDDDTEVLMSNKENCWTPLDEYDENLKTNYFEDDIIEIYRPKHIYSIANFFGANNVVKDWEIIWKREEPKPINIVLNITADASNPEELAREIEKIFKNTKFNLCQL